MTLLSYKLQKNKNFSDHRIVPRIGLETSRKSFQIFCLLFSSKLSLWPIAKRYTLIKRNLRKFQCLFLTSFITQRKCIQKGEKKNISVFFCIHRIFTLTNFLINEVKLSRE